MGKLNFFKKGGFKNFLAQFLASTVKNLLLLNLGMSGGFLVLLIGVVHNAKNGLSLTDEQVGWLASLLFMGQPLGSVVSSPLVEYLGRKRFLMVITVPCCVGWCTLYLASNPTMALVGTLIGGICIGLLEAPVKTYAGEVCTPDYRGILGAYSGLFPSVGELAVFLMSTILNWRTIAMTGICISSFAGLCLFFIPESPDWLVANGRIRDAENSLRWLRGWVHPKVVQGELTRLVNYHERKRRLPNCVTDYLEDTNEKNGDFDGTSNGTYFPLPAHDAQMERDQHLSNGPEPFCIRIRSIWEPSSRRPIVLVLLCLLITALSIDVGPMQYLHHISEELRWPLDKHWTTVVKAVVAIIGTISSTCLVSVVGKRVLFLTSLGGLFFSNTLLGAYSYVNPGPEYDHTRWFLFILYQIMTFFSSLGALCVPLVLLSEVFPFRTRGLACGLITPVCHVFLFTMVRLHLPLEKTVSLHGIFWINGFFALLGSVYIYFWLPETEGRTLQEIEAFFCKGGRPNKEERSLRPRKTTNSSAQELNSITHS